MKQFVSVFFLCIRLCMIQGKDCPNPFLSKESDSEKTKGGGFMACSVKCIEDKDSCLGIEFKDGKCFLQKSQSQLLGIKLVLATSLFISYESFRTG